MKKNILTFLVLLPAFNLFSQHLTYNFLELLHNQDMAGSPVAFENQYDGINGTAFFSPKWITAVAYTANGNTYTGLKVKFDIYRNKFFANIHDTIYDLSSANVMRFDLYPASSDTSALYSFIRGFNTPDIKPDKYIQVLAEGILTFAKHLSTDVNEVSEDGFLSKQKKFIERTNYYIISNTGQAVYVRINKKTLEKILADKWNEINKYAVEKETSFNEEKGWVLLINHYNSLK